MTTTSTHPDSLSLELILSTKDLLRPTLVVVDLNIQLIVVKAKGIICHLKGIFYTKRSSTLCVCVWQQR